MKDGFTKFTELPMKKTEYLLSDGMVLFGPKQALGSLYKEFIVGNEVIKFYLYKSSNSSFEYKFFAKRSVTEDDKKMQRLLYLV